MDAPFINENGFTDIRDIHKKKALNDVYLELGDDELDRWIAFLKAQGIFYTFKVEMKSYGTGYITGFHHDYNIANLGPYLDKKSEALNRYLWDFLTNNWSYSYSYETKQVNKNRRWQQGDSTLLSKLKTSAWIMGKDGKWKVPSMVSESSISDKWIVNKTTGFLHAIEFGAEQRKIDEERQKKLEIEKLQQEKEQEAAVSLGFENAEAVLEAKENDAIIKELESYGVDVRNLLSTKRKERESKKYTLQDQLLKMRQNQFVAKEVEDEDEVYRVPNPERRVEKLHEEIKTEKAPEKKNAIIKKSAISKEEKLFVGTEYSGKCQICSKIIYKTDGTRHFAAINLLDTGHLEEEYLQGLSTGWNTLCMCPNCAAEYKYGAISFFDFQEKVVNTEVNKHYRDYYEFKIQMQGEDRVLKYTPRHLLSLQTALKFFEENKDKDVIEDNNDVIVENEVSVNIVEDYVCVVKSGDKCPKCGQSNTKNQKASIIDAKGERQIIDCRVCQCGKVYLTKRLKMQLPSDIKYNEV